VEKVADWLVAVELLVEAVAVADVDADMSAVFAAA
jgi:hypothetical protein